MYSIDSRVSVSLYAFLPNAVLLNSGCYIPQVVNAINPDSRMALCVRLNIGGINNDLIAKFGFDFIDILLCCPSLESVIIFLMYWEIFSLT
jgi:hypothetical protein